MKITLYYLCIYKLIQRPNSQIRNQKKERRYTNYTYEKKSHQFLMDSESLRNIEFYWIQTWLIIWEDFTTFSHSRSLIFYQYYLKNNVSHHCLLEKISLYYTIWSFHSECVQCPGNSGRSQADCITHHKDSRTLDMNPIFTADCLGRLHYLISFIYMKHKYQHSVKHYLILQQVEAAGQIQNPH